MVGTVTMAGIGTIGTTVIGATGKLGQIRATALNEQVRAASFAKALLLIRRKAAALLAEIAKSRLRAAFLFGRINWATSAFDAVDGSSTGTRVP